MLLFIGFGMALEQFNSNLDDQKDVLLSYLDESVAEGMRNGNLKPGISLMSEEQHNKKKKRAKEEDDDD